MSKDKKIVEEFTSDVLGYVEKESKSEYQMKLDAHLDYLSDKVLRGEISDEEYARLLNETIKGANLVVDSEFSILNKEWATLGNDVIFTNPEKELYISYSTQVAKKHFDS